MRLLTFSSHYYNTGHAGPLFDRRQDPYLVITGTRTWPDGYNFLTKRPLSVNSVHVQMPHHEVNSNWATEWGSDGLAGAGVTAVLGCFRHGDFPLSQYYLRAYDHGSNDQLGSTTLLTRLSTSTTIQSMGSNPRGGPGFQVHYTTRWGAYGACCPS